MLFVKCIQCVFLLQMTGIKNVFENQQLYLIQVGLLMYHKYMFVKT